MFLLDFLRKILKFRNRRPTNLYVVWTRRSRRVVSTPLTWEPDLVDPLTANMVWQVPDNHTITVTLFRDPRTRELEDKDWTFAIEDVSYHFIYSYLLWFRTAFCMKIYYNNNN